MASTDWNVLNDSLPIASVDRGVTHGVAAPAGGGQFVFGFNSLELVQGAVALGVNQVGFNPTPNGKGGSIRACLQRGPSGGTIGFAPFLFIGLQGQSVNDSGYILGLADGDPAHIVLRKGKLSQGLPDVAPGTSKDGVGGVLRRSSGTHQIGDWVHLRLDMIVNPNNDVILQVWKNDLLRHGADAPVWEAIPGMEQFIDDQLAINSGSQPFVNARMGYGFHAKDIIRRGFVDRVEAFRQQ